MCSTFIHEFRCKLPKKSLKFQFTTIMFVSKKSCYFNHCNKSTIKVDPLKNLMNPKNSINCWYHQNAKQHRPKNLMHNRFPINIYGSKLSLTTVQKNELPFLSPQGQIRMLSKALGDRSNRRDRTRGDYTR